MSNFLTTPKVARGTAGDEPSDTAPEYSTLPRDDPFWERLGFESWHAYMEYLRKNQSMYDPPPPVEEAAASTGLPGDELGRVRGRRSSSTVD